MKRNVMEDNKWNQPGWKTEQKYSNKVLIGNWAEERLSFTRQPAIANSSYGVDQRSQWDSEPDVSARRSALLRAEGPPSKTLLAHPGPPHHLVTLYEDSYGQRRNTSALPTLLPWPSCSWKGRPESSKRPISAAPGKLGPLQSTNRCFQRPLSQLPSLSVYRSEYQLHPFSAFCQRRHARAPPSLSSQFYAANHSNKDLDLRQCSLLQVPHHCFSCNRRQNS